MGTGGRARRGGRYKCMAFLVHKKVIHHPEYLPNVKRKRGEGDKKRKEKSKEAEQAMFWFGEGPPWLWPRSPSLTRSTWLASFPLSLARRETLLLPSKGRRVAGVGTPPEALRGRSFCRERREPGISSHFGQGQVTATGLQAQRRGFGSRRDPEAPEPDRGHLAGRKAAPSNRDATPAQCSSAPARRGPCPLPSMRLRRRLLFPWQPCPTPRRAGGCSGGSRRLQAARCSASFRKTLRPAFSGPAPGPTGGLVVLQAVFPLFRLPHFIYIYLCSLGPGPE